MNSFKLFYNTVLPKLKSFNDIYEYTNTLKNKTKGDIFEIITKYVFLLHPQYRLNTKNIWLYEEVPVHLLQRFNIPLNDMGIDLIWQDTNSKYYAIQCKFRKNNKRKVPWKELSTFAGLTYGIGNNFDGAIYVTNTYRIDKLILKSDKIVPLFGEFFENLDHTFFKQIKSHINNEIVQYVKKEPRKHQLKIVNACVEHFKDNDRCHIMASCGSGKTLASYWVNQKMDNRICIVCVPSLYLLSQFYSVWTEQTIADGHKTKYILVGSDVCTDEYYINNGLIITTNEKEILENVTKFILSDYYTNLVLITTYQSAKKLSFTFSVHDMEADLCIFDEAHKTVGEKNNQFGLLLTDRYFGIKKRMFMTATPKIYKKVGDNDESVLSMNNKKWYGKQVYNYSTRQAINDGYLSEYQICTLISDDAYVKKFMKDNKLVDVDELTSVEMHYVVSAIMILLAIEENECHHLLTYHRSIANTKKFRKILEVLFNELELNNGAKPVILQLDGHYSAFKRKRVVDTFRRSKYSILCSARVLNEGVDIPIVDSVCFIDPRTSTVDITQCIGRALRLHDRKETAKILVPIICKDINELDDSRVYGNVINVVKSVMDNDEAVETYFTLRQNGKKINRKFIRHKLYVVDKEEIKSGINVDVKKLSKMIEMKVWYRSDSWMYNYNKIKCWMEINDILPVQTFKNDEEHPLGKWCNRMREFKRKKILSERKIYLLELIQSWYWGNKVTRERKSFKERFNMLKQWMDKNNNKLPTQHEKDKDGELLGIWCNSRRQDKKKDKLSIEKIELLESLHGWFWKKKDPFYDVYEQLKQWIIINKDIPSYNSENSEEKFLGDWCSKRRIDFRKKRLSCDKIKLLELLPGWYFNFGEKMFYEGYNKVKQWVKTHGVLPVQNNRDEYENNRLGVWCSNRRKDKNKNKLDDYKIKKLEEIKCWV